MRLLAHISSTRRKERKIAKELQKIKEEAALCSTSQPSEPFNLSGRIEADIKASRTHSLQLTATPQKLSSTSHNAGSSTNVPKPPSAIKGPIPVQAKQRATSEGVTQSENIPFDGDSSGSDSSSVTGKKRSTKSKAARKRQSEIIYSSQNTPNNLPNNQNSTVISISRMYPDTKHCNNDRRSILSHDSDKAAKTGATDGQNASSSSTGEIIQEAEPHTELERSTVPRSPESTSHHSPVSCHIPQRSDYSSDKGNSSDKSHS